MFKFSLILVDATLCNRVKSFYSKQMPLPKPFFRDQEYQKLGKKILSFNVVVYFVVIQSNYGSTFASTVKNSYLFATLFWMNKDENI